MQWQVGSGVVSSRPRRSGPTPAASDGTGRRRSFGCYEVFGTRFGRLVGRLRAIAPQTPRIRNRRVTTVAVGVLAVVAIGGTLIVRGAQRPSAVPRTAIVKRQDFVSTLRLHGTVEAVRSATIAAPALTGGSQGSLRLTRLAASGTIVQPGDSVAEFDARVQARALLDRETDFRDLEDRVRAKLAEKESARARDERELAEAEHDVQRAQLDTRRNEILSRIEAEKNRQNLAKSEARLTQVKRIVALRRGASEAEMRGSEIQRDRARQAMLHASRNAARLEVRSPIPGLLVRNTIFKGSGPGEVQEGDELRPGMGFAQVVDPAAMQVRARVNQMDVGFLRVGQRCAIRLDAYPDLVFQGEVVRIGPIASAGGFSDRVRTFLVLFSVAGRDSRLLPDLSAAVDAELSRVKDALVAPRDSLFWEGRRAYVRVWRGRGGERREVQVGTLSDQEAVLTVGVDEGATLLRGVVRPSAAGTSR